MSSMLKWAWSVQNLPPLNDYTYIPIKLDLTAAVTLIATIAADPGPRAAQERDWHERALWWIIQDTINGHDWYSVASGALTPYPNQQVVRVSSPLGLHARLGVCAVVATVRPGYSWSRCEGKQCDANHAEFAAERVRFDVAVRTI